MQDVDNCFPYQSGTTHPSKEASEEIGDALDDAFLNGIEGGGGFFDEGVDHWRREGGREGGREGVDAKRKG